MDHRDARTTWMLCVGCPLLVAGAALVLFGPQPWAPPLGMLTVGVGTLFVCGREFIRRR